MRSWPDTPNSRGSNPLTSKPGRVAHTAWLVVQCSRIRPALHRVTRGAHKASRLHFEGTQGARHGDDVDRARKAQTGPRPRIGCMYRVLQTIASTGTNSLRPVQRRGQKARACIAPAQSQSNDLGSALQRFPSRSPRRPLVRSSPNGRPLRPDHFVSIGRKRRR